MNSVLGGSARFVGDVAVVGTIRIDGEIEGNVEASERVHIGRGGVVNGSVAAQDVIVTGSVGGSITASGKVHLQATAALSGDVACQRLVIEEGARFDGASVMGGGQQKLEVLETSRAHS